MGAEVVILTNSQTYQFLQGLTQSAMLKLKFRDSDPNMFSLKLNTALRKDFGLRAFDLCCHRIDPL